MKREDLDAWLSANNIKVNPESGMPVVPDRYFWRVIDRNDSMSVGGPTVELRRKLKLFGSVREREQRIYTLGHGYPLHHSHRADSYELRKVSYHDLAQGFTPETILFSAGDLLINWREKNAEKLAYDATRNLYGNYPPKKLGA